MTIEELNVQLKELEGLLNTGSLSELVTQGKEVLLAPSLELYPELHSNILLTVGEALLRSSLYPEALPFLEKAVELCKHHSNDNLKARALSYTGIAHGNIYNPQKAIELLHQAIELQERTNDRRLLAGNLHNLAMVLSGIADYTGAMEYYFRALEINEEFGNRLWMANNLASIGRVLSEHYDLNKGQEHQLRALELYESLGEKRGTADSLLNIGGVYSRMGEDDRALEYYAKAQSIAEEMNLHYIHSAVAVNMGEVYRKLGDYDKAMEYYLQTLSLAEDSGHIQGLTPAIGNIGILYGDRDYSGYNPSKAEEFLLKAIAQSVEHHTEVYTVELLKHLSDFYHHEERWKDSDTALRKSIALQEKLQLEDIKTKAAQHEIRSQISKQEKEMAVERATHEATQKLLYKTLPESIATRILSGEKNIADKFENVSILFADVVGFTKISTQMPPAAVLGFMNFIFEHFDALAAKHGCERIKTIGDGYMAVCGAPVKFFNHAERLALMALDMVEDIVLPEEIRKYLPKGTLFHLRLGLHCGEITAGLIGAEKLAYDIYGDAVNTASRMESHGEAGRIHVSEEFRIAVETQHLASLQMTFIERGEMEIKGKGMMKTYFLEKHV